MEIKRATLKSFDSGAYTATVQVAGRSCALVLFDPSTPSMLLWWRCMCGGRELLRLSKRTNDGTPSDLTNIPR